MSSPGSPPARRRFAPVPIETTFERYRKSGPQQSAPTGPVAEPTPEPSPRSPEPQTTLWAKEPVHRGKDKKEPRRFMPQLIESSRRSRRTGDIGPATKPTDKTDITPYHNHIYSLRSRKKQHHHNQHHNPLNRRPERKTTQSLARRESCDEDTAAHVFEMLAREAEKRMLEDAALAAFPNSGARAGGAEHFIIREGSDDESTDSTGDTQSRELTGPGPAGRPRILRGPRRSRRDSLTEDVGWALREMQEHHDQLTKVRTASMMSASPAMRPTEKSPFIRAMEKSPYMRANLDGSAPSEATPDLSLPRPTQVDRISTVELDSMNIDSPPGDPLWMTSTARQLTQDSPAGSGSLHPIGESYMPFIPEEPLTSLPRASDGFRGIPSYARQLREAEGEVDEDEELLLRESATPGVPTPSAPDKTDITNPANVHTSVPDSVSVPAHTAAAPPIPLEASFRGRNAYAGYRNRDIFASERDVIKLRRKSPPMLGKELVFPKCQSPKQTKLEPEYLWSINDVFEKSHAAHPSSSNGNGANVRGATGTFGTDSEVGNHGLWHGLCFSTDSNQAVVPIERPALLATPFPPSTPGDPFAQAFGGQMLTSLDERLQEEQQLAREELEKQEAREAELEAKIAAEFTDRFVTQVFNYLSLGYPAMARAYDDELSKISKVSVDELEGDDDDTAATARGHISMDMYDSKDGSNGAAVDYNHDSCPRWRALKLYVFEWARQHPDLDGVSPLAWGMRERRGSWGI